MGKPGEWTEKDIPLLLWGVLPMVILLIIAFLIGGLVNINLMPPVVCGGLLVYLVGGLIADRVKR